MEPGARIHLQVGKSGRGPEQVLVRIAASATYAGPKELTVWPFNGHEAGAIEDDVAALAFLQKQLAG